MSDDTAARKKRNTTESTKRVTPEDDHRRKRRNRTTQSCLNCHTSKRMCDRKRPCGRCTQLGLTGLCVYEVDDPSRKASGSDSQDEKDRLQKRVAELESVIRELKNKPHPRWVAGSNASDSAHKGAMDVVRDGSVAPPPKDIRSMPSSPTISKQTPACTIDCTSPSVNRSGAFLGSTASSHTSSRSSPFMGAMSSLIPSSPSSADSSPLDTPSPMSLSPVEGQISSGPGFQPDFDFSSLFPPSHTDRTGLEEHMFNEIFDRLIRQDGICDSSRAGEHCGCLHDPANYNVVLELSLRLRKAADTLGRASKHGSGSSNCAIAQNIAELDRFTSDALGNISTPAEPFAAYPRHDRATLPTAPAANSSLPYSGFGTVRPNPPASAPTVSPPSLQSPRSWDYKNSSSYPSPPWEDSFMSWMPQRAR